MKHYLSTHILFLPFLCNLQMAFFFLHARTLRPMQAEVGDSVGPSVAGIKPTTVGDDVGVRVGAELVGAMVGGGVFTQ